MITKFGQFKKLREWSQLCKLSQLSYHFLSTFENKIIYLDIPSYPPPIAIRNSLTNQFYQKKLRFCIFKRKRRKKVTRLNRDIHPGDS